MLAGRLQHIRSIVPVAAVLEESHLSVQVCVCLYNHATGVAGRAVIAITRELSQVIQLLPGVLSARRQVSMASDKHRMMVRNPNGRESTKPRESTETQVSGGHCALPVFFVCTETTLIICFLHLPYTAISAVPYSF